MRPRLLGPTTRNLSQGVKMHMSAAVRHAKAGETTLALDALRDAIVLQQQLIDTLAHALRIATLDTHHSRS